MVVNKGMRAKEEKGRSLPSTGKPFAITINLDPPRLTLSLRRHRGSGSENSRTSQGANGITPGTRRLLVLKARRAKILEPMVMEYLHQVGVVLPQLEGKGGGRVRLSEHDGARLVLMLWALAPLQKPSRSSLVKAGITAMSDEEVYYWYSRAEGTQSMTGRQQRNNTLKALRILLAGA